MENEKSKKEVKPSIVECKIESNAVNSNKLKPNFSCEVIKSMMLLYLHTGSKEMRNILALVKNGSTKISEIFNRILVSTKLSNKESLYFFEIMGRFSEWFEDTTVNQLVEYRFASQDKYLERLVVEYFRLILIISKRLTHEQLVEIYYKFMYLFENDICDNMAIYRLFQKFLNLGLIGLLVYKRGYMKMRFLKEFLIDFRTLGDVLVRIGYERAEIQGLVYSLLGKPFKTSWVVQRWKVNTIFEPTITELFYNCDCVYFMKNMGLRQMELESDLRNTLEKELLMASTICKNVYWCTSNISDKSFINISNDNTIINSNNESFSNNSINDFSTNLIYYTMENKLKYQKAILYFNKNVKLLEGYSIIDMYMSPMVDLSILGRFLCNHLHSNILQTFVNAFSFSGMDLLDALRLFLNGFCLIGEAQIVERVVSLFVETYLFQNNSIKEYPEMSIEYRNLAYSFLALNTMLHNSAIDKKPCFEDYLRMIKFCENFNTKKETLREYYDSIKDNEIKYPDQWYDSYDKYIMSIELHKNYLLNLHKNYNINNTINYTTSFKNDILNNSSTILSLTNLNLHTSFNNTEFCKNCILVAYKTLFKKIYSKYFSMDPTAFYELCSIIGNQNIFEAYVRYQSLNYKNNVVKLINCWCHLLENFILHDKSLLSSLIHCAKKIEYGRESIIRDLISLTENFTQVTTLSSNSEYIKSPLIHPIQPLLNISFITSQICHSNIFLLTNTGNDLIDKILIYLILKHINWFTDLDDFSVSIRNTVIAASNETITRVSPINRLIYLSTKKDLSTTDFEIYSKCRIPCDPGFELFCRFLNKYDIFDDYIKINRKNDYTTNNNSNFDNLNNNNDLNIYNENYPPFFITEFYVEQLQSFKNILRVFNSSSTILNPEVVSIIHRPPFPHAKVVYLLIKTNIFKTPLFDHLTLILESLANCLPLFLDIIHYVYPLFHYISQDVLNIFMGIFIARLKKYKKNCIACCTENKPSFSAINKLIEQLVADNFIKKDAFSLFSTINIFEI